MNRAMAGLLLLALVGLLAIGIANLSGQGTTSDQVTSGQFVVSDEGVSIPICQPGEVVHQVDASIDPEAFVGAPRVEEAATPQGIRPDGVRRVDRTNRFLTRGLDVALYRVSQLPSGGFIITAGYYCDRDGEGSRLMQTEFP